MDEHKSEQQRLFDLVKTGNFVEAKNFYLELRQKYPTSKDLYLFGIKIHVSLNENQKALDLILELKHNNLWNVDLELAEALCYSKLNRISEAEKTYQNLVKKNQFHFTVLFNYAVFLHKIKNLDEAIYYYEKASQIKSDNEELYYNLGNAFREKEDFEKAEKQYSKSIELNPSNDDAFYNKAVVLEKQNKDEEAIKNYRKAIELNNENVEAHWNLSLLLMKNEFWDEGWNEYEWRLQKKEFKISFPFPKWEGDNLKSKKILVYSEQGIGDTFQFIRGLKLLKEQDAYIILECKKFLVDFFKELDFIDEIIAEGEKYNLECDYYSPLMSLPRFVDIERVSTPYLQSDDELDEKWKNYFDQFNEKKIGIVWKGNPQNTNDSNRSCDISFFKELAKDEKLKFFSLQKLDETNVSESDLNKAGIINLFDNFKETASIIKNLDLVITVDTAIAHLAGALNVDVWTLLSTESDWRWGKQNDKTKWYPSMKLVRQERLGDWNELFQRVMILLNENPDNKEHGISLYKSGLKEYEKGNIHESINLIKESIKYYKSAEVYNNLGLLLQESDLSEAEKYYKKSIELDPQYIKACNNLAILKFKQNKFDEAIGWFKKGLAINQNDSETNFNLALTLQKIDKKDKAKKFYLKTLQNDKHFESGKNLVGIYLEEDDFVNAESIIEKYFKESDSYNFLKGNISKAKEEYDEAIEHYLKSMRIIPNYIDAYINLGSSYFLKGELENAEELYKQMISSGLVDPRLFFSLGVTLYEKGNYSEAESYIKKAIDLDSENVKFHLGLAEAFLSQNKYAEGLSEFEWRLKLHQFANKNYRFPKSLKEVAGKTVFIHCEQGFGDILNFIHLVKKLKEEYRTYIVVESRSGLNELFQKLDFIDEVAEYNERINYDYSIPIFSLMKLMDINSNDIPVNDVFFNLNNSTSKSGSKLKIGIVWTGNKYPPQNRKRHTKLDQWNNLISIKGAEIFSFQVGEEIYGFDNDITDLTSEINNFNDTAIKISKMDLIISIDSAVAHLAGSMGKETWILLPYVADWRWNLEEKFSPWYKNVKLFRQKKRNEWEEVFNLVEKKLVERISEKSK